MLKGIFHNNMDKYQENIWTLNMSDTDQNKTYSCHESNAAGYIVFTVFRSLIAFVCIMGNTLTIWTILKTPRLQLPPYSLILCLACVDLNSAAESALQIGLVITDIRYNWQSFRIICLLKETIDLFNIGANITCILFISIDRFISLISPMRYYDIMTMRKYRNMLAVSMIYIFVVAVTIIFREENLTQKSKICSHSYFLSAKASLILIVHVAIPSAVITIMYISIACIAYRKSKEMLPNRSCQFKITRVMTFVLGIYLGSYLPAMIMLSLPDTRITCELWYIVTLLFYSNTWLNPLAYAWLNRDFRQVFKKAFQSLHESITKCGVMKGNKIGVATINVRERHK